MTSTTPRARRFVICLSNEGYPTSLVVRRVYERLPDAEAEARGLFRIIDESGEDYLLPRSLFEAVELPDSVQQRLAN